MQPGERLPYRNFLESPALIRIQSAFNNRSERPGQGHKNRSDRFVFRSAGWPGNAGDRQREVRAEFFPRTLGHFARDRFAHRAVRRERFRPDTKEFLFDRVVVGHHSAQEYRRSARHIRE